MLSYFTTTTTLVRLCCSTFNWVLGNVDPMDYAPPFFCANAALEKSAPVSMFEALQSLAANTQN